MQARRRLQRALPFARVMQKGLRPSLVGALYDLPADTPQLYPEQAAGRMGEIPNSSRGLLYRRQTMLLHQYLQKFAQPEGRQSMLRELRDGQAGFLLTGPDGVGKSVLLAQCVQFARALGILTLYIPDCHRHTHGHLFIEPSAVLEGYFDTPKATEEFFKALRAAQPEVLRALPFEPPFLLPFEAPDETHPTNLLELVSWGLSRVDRLGILLKLFFDAVLALKDRPVLIALDGYNWFLHNTEYHFGEASLTSSEKDVPRVHADRLVVVRQLNRLLKRSEEGADHLLFLAAEDTSNRQSQDTPFHPELTVFHPLSVEPYSEAELRTMVDYYLRTGPYKAHYTDPQSTVLPNLDRLCYKIGFMTGHRAHGVWQQVVRLPTWTHP